MTFSVKGQIDTILKVQLNKIDTTFALYNYYTIDSTIYPRRNLIVIRQIWSDKLNVKTNLKLKIGQELTLLVFPIGPEKTVWENDTIILRGHARGRNVSYIDGQLVTSNFNKSNFKLENAGIRMEYFELKEVLK